LLLRTSHARAFLKLAEKSNGQSREGIFCYCQIKADGRIKKKSSSINENIIRSRVCVRLCFLLITLLKNIKRSQIDSTVYTVDIYFHINMNMCKLHTCRLQSRSPIHTLLYSFNHDFTKLKSRLLLIFFIFDKN